MKKFAGYLSAIPGLFLVCSLSIGNSYSQNLVQNPGFETATIGMPSGSSLQAYPLFNNSWSAANTDGEMIYDLEYPNSGTGFLSVLQNAGANPAAPWLGALNAFSGYDRAIQIIPVAASTEYELSFWVRSGESLRYAGYGEGTAFIQVEQFSPACAPIDTITHYTSNKWEHVSLQFTTGPLCSEVAVLFSVYGVAPADAWFDDVDMHANPATGIRASADKSVTLVFPNPFSDLLSIKTDRNECLQFILYDITSSKRLEQEIKGSCNIPVSQLGSGIYFYEIRNNTGLLAKGKLIK